MNRFESHYMFDHPGFKNDLEFQSLLFLMVSAEVEWYHMICWYTSMSSGFGFWTYLWCCRSAHGYQRLCQLKMCVQRSIICFGRNACMIHVSTAGSKVNGYSTAGVQDHRTSGMYMYSLGTSLELALAPERCARAQLLLCRAVSWLPCN